MVNAAVTSTPLNNSAVARAADRARIANIAARILELERSVRELRLEKELAQKRLDSYVYPVMTLPNEIISEIFLHFLPVYPIGPLFKGYLSPTLLTHICLKWREIAIATPALWRAMTLQLLNCNSDQDYSARLPVWIDRSRSLPLSFSLHRELEDKRGDIPLNECIEALIPHRARLEYLELKWVTDDVCPLFDGPLPSLKHIDLSWEDYAPSSPAVVCDAAQLRSVVISRFPDRVIFPWGQLRRLTLWDVHPSQCTAILQQCSRLTHCKLSLWDNSDDPQPDLHLPLLQSLICIPDYDSGPELPGYIDTLIVPALRTLRVPDYFLGDDPIRTLVLFISKSGCTLEQMCITGPRAAPKRAYREAFPSIGELSFVKLHSVNDLSPSFDNDYWLVGGNPAEDSDHESD
ncbi:hypothetical protein C8R43DRAFT_1049908 [Mycena crocata]|nr:hypothetical protein C8R43DRAFT_1049908 [Mycena crocata]